MKHSIKVTILLLLLFFVSQLIGILVTQSYTPLIEQVLDANGTLVNTTVYDLPYGVEPPSDMEPKSSLISIIIAITISVILMLILMKFKAEVFLRLWFFTVVVIALGISFNSFLIDLPSSSIIALIIALPLAFLKIFRQNLIVHNITEIFIYPGIAAIFVPLLNLWTIGILLILISLYDIYAVWHAKFMQKMAHYQINTLKIFSGLLIPYLGKKEQKIIQNAKTQKMKSKLKNLKVNVAILGGGDIVFPIILAGIVGQVFSPLHALIIALGATVALAGLFYYSEKGKFYPAMPFISAGCFVALAVVLIIG